MTEFTAHSIDSAPEGSRAAMESVKSLFGFVPNLYGVLAESQVAIEGYQALGEALRKGTLSEVEIQTVLLTVSRVNGCDYCVAAHTGGSKRAKVPQDVIDAIRDDTPIADARLGALVAFTTAVVEKRGWLDGELQAFIDAGYTKAQVLEVLAGVALKTLSNYANHIAQTPLDEAFQKLKWERPEAA